MDSAAIRLLVELKHSITLHHNLIMEHRSYDPFGKPRYDTMQASSTATLLTIASGTPFTQRGFTDHEHIDEAQLIHMNGRVYDYNLGRFLSVDPFIQAPGNSQSLNPYSYIMNNPLAGTDPTGYVIDTIWDVGNVIFDVGKVAYGAATGNDDMVTEGLTDLAIDAAATLIPFVPAGASKAARAGAEKVADARQASKKADTTPSTQKSESNANSDGGTKTTNGADSTQSANSANQKTTDIGSQESISSTKELRGGDFNKGKAEAQQTLNKPDNIVNSCTSCNRGAGGKGTKMPSSSPGEGKWVPSNPSDHVKDKLDKL